MDINLTSDVSRIQTIKQCSTSDDILKAANAATSLLIQNIIQATEEE